MQTLTITIYLAVLIHSINSARVLVIFPFPSTSHYILGSTLSRALAEKGHDVTVVSPYSEKTPPKNGTYRDIVLTGLKEHYEESARQSGINMFDLADGNPFISLLFFSHRVTNFMESVLKHENVQNLLHSQEKFDVVIVQQFINDAHKALATHFGAPLILFSPLGANHWTNPLVGNPSPLSYVPDTFLGYSTPMTFSERVLNTLNRILNDIYFHCFLFSKHNELIKKYIPNGPNIEDVLYNASLVFLNSHFSINQAIPYVPNMIDIGGMHVKPPKKLPEDLQEYLDSAKDGVIYFSMGSNLKSAQFPPEKRDAFLKTFAKLKQKVLWKFEEDNLPGQPSNVKISKWLPQQDVLAHPNIKLFITHGGYLSTTETIYHGVPVLAIPVFGDQKLNAKVAVNNGVGLMLPYKEISEKSLFSTIRELLENPKYRYNAKKRSELFHDRPVNALDTAVYWVEYIARHGGAPHLRVAALDLTWYQYLLLDVLGFLLLISLTSLVIFIFTVKAIVKKVSRKKKDKSKVKRS